MLDARQREAIEKKAASDGQFAIAAALLALADAVHDAGPPAAVQAIDLSFVKLAEATTAAGSMIFEGLEQLATATRDAGEASAEG